jgi:signal transduction histidine kinase
MKIKKTIFQKLLLAMIVVGIIPMIIFSLLTVFGYEDMIGKQSQYIQSDPLLVEEVNLNLINIRIQTLLIFILSIIFIVFFSLILTRRFLYPIKDLVRGIKDLQTGRLKTFIDVNTEDEFRVLAESFNEMAKKLNLKISELDNERKKSEDEKNKTAAVINNFIDPILVIDKEGKLILFNPAARMIFGFTNQTLGIKINQQNKYSMNNFKNIIQGNFTVNSLGENSSSKFNEEELIININDSESTYRVTTIDIYDSQSQSLGIMKLFYNLTREKMIDKLKSEFITIAAHQLRTPLSAVKWALKMVVGGDAGPVNKEQKDLLDKGYSSNERMIRLVNDLLNVSRIEEGKYGYDFKSQDFNEILNIVIENAYAFIRQNNLKLEISKQAKKTEIYADKEKMVLVLQSIVDNAIKYTPEFGKVKISLFNEKDMLKISVKDSGVGIPNDDLKKIFFKFFRASNVVRMQTEGSGLGLFMAKNIIEKHGGRINLSSEEGIGTEVVFDLPLKK